MFRVLPVTLLCIYKLVSIPVVHIYSILCTTAIPLPITAHVKGSLDSRWSLDMTVTLDFFCHPFVMHGF